MSNALKDRTWIIDTAASTVVDSTATIWVKRVRWFSSGASAGDLATITDANGNVLWKSVASGGNYVESDLIERPWYGGFKVTVLTSGILYIEMM